MSENQSKLSYRNQVLLCVIVDKSQAFFTVQICIGKVYHNARL